MPTKQIHETELVNGDEVKFKHKRQLSEHGARFDIWLADSDDDRKWRVDVLEDDAQIVATYRGSEMSDVPRPGWLGEWAASVRRTPA